METVPSQVQVISKNKDGTIDRRQAVEIAQSRRVKLEKLIRDTDLWNLLKRYMNSILNGEIGEFFDDLSSYQSSKDPESKLNSFRYIIDEYIHPDSPKCLNVPGCISESLINLRNFSSKDYFDKMLKSNQNDPLSEVIQIQKHTLKDDIIPRFIRSDDFIDYIRKNSSKIFQISEGKTEINTHEITDETFANPFITQSEIKFIQNIVNDTLGWEMTNSKVVNLYHDRRKLMKNKSRSCNMSCYYRKGNPLNNSYLFQGGDMIRFEGTLNENIHRCVAILMHSQRICEFDEDMKSVKVLEENDNLENTRHGIIINQEHAMPGPFSHVLGNDNQKMVVGAFADKHQENITVVLRPYLRNSSVHEARRFHFLGMVFFRFTKVSEYMTRYTSGGIVKFDRLVQKLVPKVIQLRNDAIYNGMSKLIRRYANSSISDIIDENDPWYRCVSYAYHNPEGIDERSNFTRDSESCSEMSE